MERPPRCGPIERHWNPLRKTGSRRVLSSPEPEPPATPALEALAAPEPEMRRTRKRVTELADMARARRPDTRSMARPPERGRSVAYLSDGVIRSGRTHGIRASIPPQSDGP